ncbi:MAG: sulfatase [Pirellulaceae bacterium]|nr:sulfatase [Pirellulaceae bacterium]
MRRARFVYFASFVAALLLGLPSGPKPLIASPQDAPGQRPNILLITSEDNGAHLGCYGDKNVATPNLDKLAAEGVRFENVYVSTASCSSSRGTILTGLFPHQSGQFGLATHKFTMFRCWPTIPGILAADGYRTAVIGKLHVNPEKEAFKGCERIDVGRNNNFLRRDVRAVARGAGEFMRRSEDPFFLMVNYPDAHLPFLRQQYGLPKKPLDGADVDMLPFVGADSPRLRDAVANYYNCVKRLDTGMGLLLAELEQSGKADNTLVIYQGDHGAQFSRGKLTCYESGLRVPMIIRWPSRAMPGLVRPELVMTADILPTVLDAANIVANAETPRSLPGRSLLPLLDDGNVAWREYMHGEYNASTPGYFFPQRAVRDGRYKLIVNLLQDRPNPIERGYTHTSHLPGRHRHGTTQDEIDASRPEVRRAYATWREAPPMELYDLVEDPCEFNNLADKPEYAEVQQRLADELRDWRKRTNDPLLDPEKLERLTAEMDAMGDDLEYGYRKDPNFKWQYPSYLYSGMK